MPNDNGQYWKEQVLDEIEDLEAAKKALFREAVTGMGLDPDDPGLQDEFNEMDPDELLRQLPDTSFEDDQIAELSKKLKS